MLENGVASLFGPGIYTMSPDTQYCLRRGEEGPPSSLVCDQMLPLCESTARGSSASSEKQRIPTSSVQYGIHSEAHNQICPQRALASYDPVQPNSHIRSSAVASGPVACYSPFVAGRTVSRQRCLSGPVTMLVRSIARIALNTDSALLFRRQSDHFSPLASSPAHANAHTVDKSHV